MNSSRVNALKTTVNRHIEAVSRLLLSSKETLEKRGIIKSAFRHLRAVRKSYVSVVGASGSEICVSRGPTVEMSDTISFLVVPSENKRDKYVSSQVTKDTMCRVLKPTDCDLKVRRISYARDNDVRIEAFSPDIEKIKAHPGLAEAGLTVRENIKLNPWLIIHGVIYIFTPKKDRRITSCILEVTPAVRRTLLGCGRIYLCLSFSHIAKDCKGKPSCEHCAHEMKDCRNRDQPSKCLNCERHHVSHGDLAHSAMDAAKCSVLGRRVKDKIANTNYE
ncbi:hypothetical protein ACFW04_011636 [Cataglyphis niger]